MPDARAGPRRAIDGHGQLEDRAGPPPAQHEEQRPPTSPVDDPEDRRRRCRGSRPRRRRSGGPGRGSCRPRAGRRARGPARGRSTVSVLTIPSAATTTATRASASNRPNTWPSALSTAPGDRLERVRLEGQPRRASASSAAGPRRPRRARKRTARASAPSTPKTAGGVGPADEDRLAPVPGQRPLDDRRRRAGRRPCRRRARGVSVEPTVKPGPRRRRLRGRIATPPASRPASAAARSPAMNRSRPSASEVGARRRPRHRAGRRPGDVERRDRADRGPRRPGREVADDVLVEGDGPDRASGARRRG